MMVASRMWKNTADLSSFPFLEALVGTLWPSCPGGSLPVPTPPWAPLYRPTSGFSATARAEASSAHPRGLGSLAGSN